jgi:hypothetical protein
MDLQLEQELLYICAVVLWLAGVAIVVVRKMRA